ncbi:hypothetical protein [Methylobacterium soli]|uniref:Uncharacterized protein n=1 Tax=Methylobacterium soli TaxID=553447 RepID=A0A6L3T029_9HYPH|nr:hypothetical protein [Methylobacterium soli]KAB1079819.1 hypothetical protein F6X53_08620 [Methylobacterium soli]
MLDYADASTSEPVNRQSDIVRGPVVSAQDSDFGVPPRRVGPLGPPGSDRARHPRGAVAGMPDPRRSLSSDLKVGLLVAPAPVSEQKAGECRQDRNVAVENNGFRHGAVP